jgi:hypothetical protein
VRPRGRRRQIKGKGGIDYLGGTMTKMAEVSDKITIVRSMSSKTGVHDAGTYIMKTGYEPRGTIVHPCMGAWASHFLGRIKGVTLPDSVSSTAAAPSLEPASSRRRSSPIPISNPRPACKTSSRARVQASSRSASPS